MASQRNLEAILEGYDLSNLSLGALGSHSALDVCRGALDEGFANFVIARQGREKTYTRAFKERQRGTRGVGCVRDVFKVDKWSDSLSDEATGWIRARNGVVVPSRSLAVYLRDQERLYDPIKEARVPYFGNIALLQVEERSAPYRSQVNQDLLMEEAGLPVPQTFTSPQSIDRPVLIKASQAVGQRDFERGFVTVNSASEYDAALESARARGKTQEEQEKIDIVFSKSLIQEYIDGPLINLNFFYSAVWQDLELLGVDTRTQFANGEEATHTPISLRESLVEQAVNMGESLVGAVGRRSEKGLVGPFAIQCIGDREGVLRPIDLSLRIPGSPDAGATPYPIYLFGERVDFGRRIAMELKDAVERNMLNAVLS